MKKWDLKGHDDELNNSKTIRYITSLFFPTSTLEIEKGPHCSNFSFNTMNINYF